MHQHELSRSFLKVDAFFILASTPWTLEGTFVFSSTYCAAQMIRNLWRDDCSCGNTTSIKCTYFVFIIVAFVNVSSRETSFLWYLLLLITQEWKFGRVGAYLKETVLRDTGQKKGTGIHNARNCQLMFITQEGASMSQILRHKSQLTH